MAVRPLPVFRSPEVAVAAAIAALAAAGAVLLGAKAIVLPLVLGAAIIAFLAILLRPERAFLVLVLGLPPYVMVLAALYGSLGVPPLAIRAIQPWKELVMATALLGCTLRLLRRGEAPVMAGLDWIVIAFLVLNVAYLVFPSEDSGLVARVAAMRTNVTFVLLYALGRLAEPGELTPRVAGRAFAVLAIATVAGVVIEKALLPTDWPVRIGYSRFLIDFFGDADVQSYDELPWTFWTEAKLFRRPSAFFANPLDLAAGCLLMLAFALAAALLRQERKESAQRWYWLAAALATVLFASLARMAVATMPFVCFVVAVVLGRARLAFGILITMIAVGIIGIMLAGPLVQEYVRSTLMFENASSAGHVDAWTQALTAILTHPLGIGLGTSGAIGARGGEAVGGENQYLIMGVQLGWAGLLLYSGVLASAFYVVQRALRRHRDELYAVAVGGLVTLAFLGLTSEVGTYMFVSFITWWLVGYSVSGDVASQVAARRETLRKAPRAPVVA